MLRTSRCLRTCGSAATLVVALALAPETARADTTLVASAQSVAHELGAAPRRALVIASPLTSDVAAPRGDELAVRMASLVAAAMGGDASAEEHATPLAAARARSRARSGKISSVVYLDVRVDAGELRINADVYPVVSNGWDRVRLAPPPPVAHAYIHAPISAEVRSYLTPVHLERSHVTRFTHDRGALLAIACGDLDEDGGSELVLVSQREVAWGYLRDGHFVTVRRVAASSLGGRAAVPWREPLATAQTLTSGGRGTLFVGWSDRRGASMGPELAAATHLAGLPVSLGTSVACALPNAARGGFDSALVRCDDGKPLGGPSVGAGLPALVDGWAGLDVVRPDGSTDRFVATRDPSDTLHLFRAGTADTLVAHDVGAQIAIADLDQDGAPELITTMPRSDDALVISSWRGGELVPRVRFPAPAGVDAVAVCPADLDGAPSVVAAVGSEIWLVH